MSMSVLNLLILSTTLLQLQVLPCVAMNSNSNSNSNSNCGLLERTVFVEHGPSDSDTDSDGVGLSRSNVRKGASSTTSTTSTSGSTSGLNLGQEVTKKEEKALREAWQQTYQQFSSLDTSTSQLDSKHSENECPRTIQQLELVKHKQLKNDKKPKDNNHHMHMSHHHMSHQHQPLPPWFHYEQMMAWNVAVQTPTTSSPDSSLLFQGETDAADFSSAYSGRLQQRKLRHLEQVEQLLEVNAFDCSSSSSSSNYNTFQASVLLELQVEDFPTTSATTATARQGNVPAQSPSAQLYEEIQIWKQAFQTTYNTLLFYTCDAPTFTTIIEVQVEEWPIPDSYPQFDTTTTTNTTTQTTTKKLLEFQLTVECRGDGCDEHMALFGTLETGITLATVNTTAAPSILPSGWRPPKWQDLQGPALRQADDVCYCAATPNALVGLPTIEQFQLALETTLTQLHTEGLLQEYADAIDTLNQMSTQEEDDNEEACQEDNVSSIETQVLLQLSQPLFAMEHDANATSTTTVQDVLNHFVVSYNQLSLRLCDQPFARRIVNVSLAEDYQVGVDQQLIVRIQAECHGCTDDDIQNQAWLFNETDTAFAISSINETLIASYQLELLPLVPVLTCACPVDTATTTPETSGRAPTVPEVMLTLNARLEQNEPQEQEPIMVTALQQVEDYECHAPQDTLVSYTNVLVNFTGGNPQLLTNRELTLLEKTFEKTYNDLTFQQCDGKFRQITQVQLLILPRRLYHHNGTNSSTIAANSNSTNSTTGYYYDNSTDAGNYTSYGDKRMLLEDDFGRPATTYNRSRTISNTTTLEDPLEVETTSVFRVGVECRRCPATEDTDTFGLFDSFERRRELQQLAKNTIGFSSSFLAYADQSALIKPQHEMSACYCPAGQVPDDDIGTTEDEFLEIFQGKVEQLANESALENVESVDRVEELQDYCINDFEEAEANVIIDLVQYDDYRNITLYTDEEVRDAFRTAANSFREDDCAPLVRQTKKILLMPLDASNARDGDSGTDPAVRADMDVDVMEKGGASFEEYLSDKTDNVVDGMWTVLRNGVMTRQAALEAAKTMPSSAPSMVPSSAPTDSPTPKPTDIPSSAPSDVPSSNPSTDSPTGSPTASPTWSSGHPTSTPSAEPSLTPSSSPSLGPSSSPSGEPSSSPSSSPTISPTTLADFCGFTTITTSFFMGFDSTYSMDDDTLTSNFIAAYEAVRLSNCAPLIVSASVAQRIEGRRLNTAAIQIELSLTLNQADSDPFLQSEGELDEFVSSFSSTSGTSAAIPTAAPTPPPTHTPTDPPTEPPTEAPVTSSPNASPSVSPSTSASPSVAPSGGPSMSPSDLLSAGPSASSDSPSAGPSAFPSSLPSANPSASPSSSPRNASPSTSPSTSPSDIHLKPLWKSKQCKPEHVSINIAI
ncbi:Membrane [Seminavis robusta]|uniref:Circumsporozoite protein n=1 Tax=Seminavis robusta TaxID=568900 RepID=A0A9N8E1R4_9STRA|nr:Membrane [Seminavis robusta]|eukprot:Sro564_g167320.1 Membrane (1408) ;mRNA; r:16299-21215